MNVIYGLKKKVLQIVYVGNRKTIKIKYLLLNSELTL